MKTATAADRTARPSRAFHLSSGHSWSLKRLLPRRYSRRRRILVDTRYQLRTALVSATGKVLLLCLMALILQQVSARSTREILAAAPFLRESLAVEGREQIALLIGIGFLFIAAAFFLEVLESRRTAGAVLNVRRRMEEVRAGRLNIRATLRRHDHFPELAGACNEMVDALRSRAEGDLAMIRRLSSQASELLREEALGNRESVRRIAGTLRQSLEDARRRKEDLLEP